MRNGNDIVNKLGGRRTRIGWEFRCPCHDDRKPSCSLLDSGYLKCFAHCDYTDIAQALDALGFTDDGIRTTFEPIDINARIKKAQELWNEAPFDAEVILHYFGRRRISRPDVPSCIRCHGLNGIMAAVQQLDGTITAVHCKNLYRRRKDPVGITHGPMLHGAVQLAPPLDGKLGLAEGIEDALSVTELTGVPCWATLGAKRLPQINIPAGVREVVIFPDNDEAGREAETEAWHSYPEYDVSVWRPPEPHKDWNDYLKAKKEGAR